METSERVTQLEETIAWLDDWTGQLEETIAAPSSDHEARLAALELPIVQRLRQSYVETRDELAAIVAKNPVSLEEIKHCRTQREVLYAVAERNRGKVHTGEVAQLILDARMSKAPKDSIRAHLTHFVTDHEDWANLGRSHAWLLKFGPAPED